MRIAFLNPWRNASENQAFRSLQIAAARIGHEVVACTNSDDLEQASPEFVLAVASIQPKLTRFPTYGVIHEPRDRFLGTKEYFRNLLTYDGYLTISDTLRAFLAHLMHGVGRPTPIGFYFLTSQENVPDPDFLSRLERGDVRLTYFGTNWDKRRARFFQQLSQRPDVEIYGPEQAWQGIRPEAYKGAPPFDGISPQNIYRQNGVGLVLLSDKHLADDIISNRIFEITSVGAIAVCCRMSWLERCFGDSVYYFDPHCSDRALVDQLGKIVDQIKANPAEAFSRARRAQRIFQEQFSAEKLLQSAVAYHSEVQSAPGPRYTSADAPDPLISVIVRLLDLQRDEQPEPKPCV